MSKIQFVQQITVSSILLCPATVFTVSSNRIGDVMVSVLASSAVDRGFEQSKVYKIGICCFSA